MRWRNLLCRGWTTQRFRESRRALLRVMMTFLPIVWPRSIRYDHLLRHELECALPPSCDAARRHRAPCATLQTSSEDRIQHAEPHPNRPMDTAVPAVIGIQDEPSGPDSADARGRDSRRAIAARSRAAIKPRTVRAARRCAQHGGARLSD